MNSATADSEVKQMCQRLAANDPSLTILNLAHQYVYDEDVFQLARAIRENTNVIVLILSGNCIKDNGARCLAEALPPCVQYLYLGHNDIRNEGAKALASLKHLKILDLQSNSIMDDGARHLARLVVDSKRLQSLRLDTNEIGVRGILFFADALRVNKTLHTLQLKGNTTDVAGYNALRGAFQDNGTLTRISYSCPAKRSIQTMLNLHLDMRRTLKDLDLLPKYWPVLLQKFQSEAEILHAVVRGRPDMIGCYAPMMNVEEYW